MALALATHTMPAWWLDEPDEVIVTAIGLLEKGSE